MIVIKPRAVRKDEVALHLVERKRPMRVDLRKLVLFLILLQSGRSKAARIFVRIFATVIPRPLKGSRQIARTNSIDSTTGSTVSRSFRVIPYSVSSPKRTCLT